MNKKIKSIFSLLLMVSMIAGVRADTPAEAPTPTETQTPPDPDGGWPRTVTSAEGSQVQIFQPQVESWEGQQKLVAWAAVECLVAGQDKSKLGVVKWETPTSVAKEERLVKLTNIEIQQVNFPTLSAKQARDVTMALKALFPKEVTISLDRILAAVDKSAIRAGGVNINQKPPPIFTSMYPAVLVQFDGEPIISPIKDSTLKFIVNTNWDVLQDPGPGLYYLRYEKSWFSSKTIEKDWELTKKLPPAFETLPKDPNWDDVRAAVPAKGISGDKPFILVSKVPAEIILVDGKPKTEQVGKTKLLWVKNTESDLFRMKKGAFYYLVSGRWFKADTLKGPWTFATPNLPAEFLQIPPTHERARVRASIPGTDEATEAVLLAQIPQTLRINRKGLDIPEVKYEGEPKFKEVEGAKVSYATNCSNDVLKVGDIYYLCFQGAWLQSRKPNGPWELTTSVPAEIYKIPADCPLHHVTYVKVGSSDAETVTYVYDSGYSGVTVSFGIAMYGTGWYYPPYYGYGGYYPAYYPYPCSYGGNAIYNSRTGAYGYGSSVSGPNGGLAHAATYNPNTGTYARGSAAWGPSGSQMNAQAYNPRTGTSMNTSQNRNSNGSWGNTKVQRGDSWAQTGHVKNDQGSVRGARTSEGNGVVRAKGENGSGFVGKQGDDIYAGKDGNVYRKNEDGWQKHTEGGWSDVERGQPKAGTSDRVNRDQLNRDASARQQGNQRTRDYSRPSAGTSNRGGGSYGGSRGGGSYGGSRGGGGGSRGGGGGRRR